MWDDKLHGLLLGGITESDTAEYLQSPLQIWWSIRYVCLNSLAQCVCDLYISEESSYLQLLQPVEVTYFASLAVCFCFSL